MKKFCYNCKYFEVLNTDAYPCSGLCKHPLLLRGWYYDTRNFREVCEYWEERNNANTSKGGEKGI